MNRRQRFTLAAALATALLAGGCPSKEAPPEAIVNGHAFTLEIADNRDAQTIGLGGRPSLAAGAGMLFVFPTSGPRVFHMKDCFFPIDVAFLDADGTIINLATMAVEADPANPVRQYRSHRPSKYVLETLGGTWKKIGAKPGDTVTFRGVFDQR